MSLVTISEKRNRIYARRFDHEEALVRNKAGESMASLASEYGVSLTAVARVINPNTRARITRNSKKSMMSGVCRDCGKKGIAKKSPRCADCSALHRSTTVKPETLLCSTCRLWLPDEAFGVTTRYKSRRYRRRTCRACGSAARIEYRKRNRVLCEGGCGTLVEGKGRAKGENPDRPYFCRKCSLESVVGYAGCFLPLLGANGIESETPNKGGE